MGNTFTGQTLTQTGKIGPDTIDPSQVSFGNLGLIGATITSQSPFVGPFGFIVGSDVKLIHGDCWNEIQGQVTEDDGLGVTTTIGKLALPGLQLPGSPPSCGAGWEKLTLHGTRTTTVLCDDDETIYGSSNYTYIDTQNNTFNQTVTTNYASAENINQPTSQNVIQATSIQCYGFLLQWAYAQLNLNGYYIQAVLSGLAVPPIASGIYMTLVAGFNLTLDFVNVQGSALCQVENKATKIEAKALSAALFAGKVNAGGGEVRAAASVGVAPHPPTASG